MFKILITIGISSLCVQLASAQTYNDQCLAAHNKYRRLHGVADLVFNSSLADLAQNWAQYLAETNLFVHRPNNTYGECLYAMIGDTTGDCDEAVKAWYDEIKLYNFDNPGFSHQTGHFTQVVWKTTEQVGCAFASNDKNYYVVCNYNPIGNYIGRFTDNVPRPINP